MTHRDPRGTAKPDLPLALLVAPRSPATERVAEGLRRAGLAPVSVTTAAQARDRLGKGAVQLIVVRSALPDGRGEELVAHAAAATPLVPVILVADEVGVADAVDAIRAGASDILPGSAGADEVAWRARAAMQRARAAAEREQRVDRLKGVCRRLSASRTEVSRQVTGLCNDLVDAYQEMSDRLVQVTAAAEFGSLVRPELEVENLLRVGLEYMVGRTGPTNAAVFLPATSRDFTLGAYVNYDCPKETVDVLFDHLAAVVPSRVEDQEGVRVFDDGPALAEFLGDGAGWLDRSAALIAPCRHEGECLAVIMMFRRSADSFTADVAAVMRSLAEIFGRQLGTVIHVHHRHLPRDQWGAFGGPDESDDLGLAA